ncbi:MAG: metal ABC transporter ATP-binding protein [Pseudomonadota bacterium]
MIEQNINGPTITFNDVCVNEGLLQLIGPVNCTFEAGMWHGVLGPNGSGKSTLLKSILGLKNHGGTIRIENHNTAENTQIGYLPQIAPFDVSLPVSLLDYLLMSIKRTPVFFKRDLDNTIHTALMKVDLLQKINRRVGDLSGGERQRLMLVSAMLNKPGLLLLDEPMSGLDKDGRNSILELLAEFRDAGGTIIMVEHDWSIVRSNCERIHWLDREIKASESGEHLDALLTSVIGDRALIVPRANNRSHLRTVQ